MLAAHSTALDAVFVRSVATRMRLTVSSGDPPGSSAPQGYRPGSGCGPVTSWRGRGIVRAEPGACAGWERAGGAGPRRRRAGAALAGPAGGVRRAVRPSRRGAPAVLRPADVRPGRRGRADCGDLRPGVRLAH